MRHPPTPHKRAVQFLEPRPARGPLTVVARQNGLRVWFYAPPPPAAPPPPPPPSGWWGRMLVQPWHFAMLRDQPRNEAKFAEIRQDSPRFAEIRRVRRLN